MNEELEMAEGQTTAAADEDDLELAVDLVQAIQTDREAAKEFVESL